MAEVLIDRRDDGVAVVTLNRPDSLNAMSASLQFSLAETLRAAARDRHEALNLRLSGQSADHREAARAFVEKRSPAFRGA